MREQISWAEKYNLGLQESLSIKGIMKLRSCGQPMATKIRNDALVYCADNNIDFQAKRVPTEAVFAVTSHSLDYYYEKMIQESKSLKYCA